MPVIYLDKGDQNRRVAQVIQKLQPFCDVKETDQRIIISNTGTIRIERKRLEEALGSALADGEWRSKFAVNIGEVTEYSDRQFVIVEEPPGDY